MKKPKQRLSDLSRVTQLISGGISILGSVVPQLILGSEWEGVSAGGTWDYENCFLQLLTAEGYISTLHTG